MGITNFYLRVVSDVLYVLCRSIRRINYLIHYCITFLKRLIICIITFSVSNTIKQYSCTCSWHSRCSDHCSDCQSCPKTNDRSSTMTTIIVHIHVYILTLNYSFYSSILTSVVKGAFASACVAFININEAHTIKSISIALLIKLVF